MTKDTAKKARSGEEKAGTWTNQAEVDAFSAQVSEFIGRTAGSVSEILGDAAQKIKDLAGDETLKPIFKQLQEYLQSEYKTLQYISDLFGKVSVPVMSTEKR